MAGGVPKATRVAVVGRSEGFCERCDQQPPVDVHHRLPRRMGGTSNATIHDLPNLVALCRDCHGWVESHRVESVVQGWVISQHDGRAPGEVPLFRDGRWWRLTSSGWELLAGIPPEYDPPF